MRALARWGATPLLAAPLGAWAFGLGDIELQSALNQPFQAQITLVSATPEDLAGLRVALAGDDTFARYGVDRPSYLSFFDFRVSTDRSGQPVIEVTSRQAIPEPFVTLRIEEHRVLLDRPAARPGGLDEQGNERLGDRLPRGDLDDRLAGAIRYDAKVEER